MRTPMVTPISWPTIKPDTYSGTSVPVKAKILKNGIAPALYMRTPWPDADTGCDCGRGSAKPVFHARWCEVRIEWSYGDE